MAKRGKKAVRAGVTFDFLLPSPLTFFEVASSIGNGDGVTATDHSVVAPWYWRSFAKFQCHGSHGSQILDAFLSWPI